MALPTTCADIKACGPEMLTVLNAIYAEEHSINSQVGVLLPISTTTLQNIDDGTVIDSMIHNDAGVWLIGCFCAVVFIMGWRAAE